MAADVSKWFANQGYSTYVATEVQTIRELNSQIIDALKSSDYFLFINLPRESVSFTAGCGTCRGSIYSNQELAVAHAFGFEHMILVTHKNVVEEGVSKFLVVNTPKFDELNEILPIVQDAVAKSGWKSVFSRHLQLSNLRSMGHAYTSITLDSAACPFRTSILPTRGPTSVPPNVLPDSSTSSW